MANRSYAGGAQAATLTSPVGDIDTTINVNALVGWPDGSEGPFAAVIEPGEVTEEKVLLSSNNGTSVTVAQRGYDGTAGVSHPSGAIMEHCITATDIEESNRHVNSSVGVHGLGAQEQVVGTTKAQTLTGKTISGQANTITNVPLAGSPQIGDAIDAEETARIAADTNLGNLISGVESDLSAETSARAAGDNDRYTKAQADAAFTTDAEAGTIADARAAAAVSQHAAAGDPHAIYLTQAEADLLYSKVKLTGVTEVHVGGGTVTPNASGKATVTHGAPFTPTGVSASLNDDESGITATAGKVVNVVAGSATATTFVCYVYRNDNGNPVTAGVKLRWSVSK